MHDGRSLQRQQLLYFTLLWGDPWGQLACMQVVSHGFVSWGETRRSKEETASITGGVGRRGQRWVLNPSDWHAICASHWSDEHGFMGRTHFHSVIIEKTGGVKYVHINTTREETWPMQRASTPATSQIQNNLSVFVHANVMLDIPAKVKKKNEQRLN